MINAMVRRGEITEEEAQLITHHLLSLFSEGLQKFKAAGKLDAYFEHDRNGWYEQ